MQIERGGKLSDLKTKLDSVLTYHKVKTPHALLTFFLKGIILQNWQY